MPDEISLENLSRGQLLQLANMLTERAMEVKEAERKIVKPKMHGSPRDPAVRKAAALFFHRAYDIEGKSFEDIGDMLGVSRERAFQLYHDLFPQEEGVETS